MSDFKNQFFKNIFDILKLKRVWMISLLLKDVQEKIEKEYNRDSVYHKPILTHDEFITLLNEYIKNNLETTEDIVKVILRDIENQGERAMGRNKSYKGITYKDCDEVINDFKELKTKINEIKDNSLQHIKDVINSVNCSKCLDYLFTNKYSKNFQKAVNIVLKDINKELVKLNEHRERIRQLTEKQTEENKLIPIDGFKRFTEYFDNRNESDHDFVRRMKFMLRFQIGILLLITIFIKFLLMILVIKEIVVVINLRGWIQLNV